jgi:hypothetical protein
MTIEFKPWPKTPRLFRDILITEKIDGTNAAVIVMHVPDGPSVEDFWNPAAMTAFVSAQPSGWEHPGDFIVAAQSRNRLITPEKDNFGFANWVKENAADLATLLGEGHHYGEWWGSGIQRGYGLTKGEKRFSLFNVHRYGYVRQHPVMDGPLYHTLDVVPTLYAGPFSEEAINLVDLGLRTEGSQAAPGFDNPEGFVVFHTASGQVYKVLLEGDDTPKSVLGRT